MIVDANPRDTAVEFNRRLRSDDGGTTDTGSADTGHEGAVRSDNAPARTM
jgi:hypothetical protein